ncbi:NAD-glutamate dehydrogenase [Facilibium subflavum]|uniref:NAD-glutamate dehydrogenase n=1 Tax=Facilibium subflavum TaxID=2219058 RepID=UPI000E6532A1|nr:NAD-glutamate dehydrogenase [Facilibium subflavum]
MHYDERVVSLLERLTQTFHEKFPKRDADNLTALAHAYTRVVATDELSQRDFIDLYGSIVSFWKFIYKRKPDELLVRAYNPTFEQHGWDSRHTVVEIASVDSPFIVDTLMMLMSSLGLGMHFMMNVGGVLVKRNENGEILELQDTLDEGKTQSDTMNECLIIVEVDRQTDKPENFEHLEKAVKAVYKKLKAIVEDFQPMKQEVQTMIHEVEKQSKRISKNYYEEAIDFLEFLRKDHFIFFGYCEFESKMVKGQHVFQPKKETALGLLALDPNYLANTHIYAKKLDEDTDVDAVLTVGKSDFVSQIHRAAYMDIISVNVYDDKGKIIGDKRLLGLYTSAAYHSSPDFIPFLRLRKQMILERSGFRRHGHAYKALSNIIDTYPRDELFLSSDEELLNTCLGIYHLRERQVMKLFVRQDPHCRYYFCMLFLPRDRYNSTLRERVERILLSTFNGGRIVFKTNFLESVLCRIDFTVYMEGNAPVKRINLELLEEKLELVERQWEDDLFDALIDEHGENKGRQLFDEYCHAFTPSYTEDHIARKAVLDVNHFEEAKQKHLSLSLHQRLEENPDRLRFKVYLRDETIQLSNVMAILENFGLHVIEEKPYKITPASGGFFGLSDFGLSAQKRFDINRIGDLVKESFTQIWSGVAENDRFNSLTIYAGLSWREVALVRAYARYLAQIGVRFSQKYIEDTFIEYADIIHDIVTLFHQKFDPQAAYQSRQENCNSQIDAIKAKLADVASLDQDKILRRMLEIVEATLRTNYYQLDSKAQRKDYMSFKLMPSKISDMPKPVPMFEIFMYSPRVEGVHLRGAKIARGGLRWSDRKEDYRTEVLGLVKAQQVKNAVIVPLGAKGGFLPKKLPVGGGRQAVVSEAIECYKIFISSLLDITDNIKNKQLIKPENVICYDEDDPYLVVAADKGTATFSDTANEVANQYDFWLGDAFASGGSNGYDHKKMAITARGAWESVKHHFRKIGKDIQSEDFTVVGIGDMSGDVFGNGMLLSKHIRLVGAFNHMHIFIDPAPDAAVSYKERRRLFDMPRSSWEDYDTSLISKGGGVFSRSAKSIHITKEMKVLLGTTADSLEPNEVIRLLLQSEVELLWNGGIGTYVKAHTESHDDVGDRANDAVRVDGSDLNCHVVGEGGNLGFTQLGRIEYALKDGAINTDAIDNSAGVDCSDHEVNIKILLNAAVERGDISMVNRNKLLAKMSDEVAHLVLQNNQDQNKGIANELQQQKRYIIEAYMRLMRELERKMQLDREVEFLPTDKVLHTRSLSGNTLTAPEFAVIMAYTKTLVKQQILKSTLPDDPYFTFFLYMEFPKELREKYADLMLNHALRREIVATQMTNKLILHVGVTFIQRLYDETGASVSDIVKAFCAVIEMFDIDKLWHKIDQLDGKVMPDTQQAMLQSLFRFVRRNCRWILRNEVKDFAIQEIIQKYKAPAKSALTVFPKLLIASEKQRIDGKHDRLIGAGVPEDIVQAVLALKMSTSVMDLMQALQQVEDQSLFEKVAIALNQKLRLSWFRGCINSLGGSQSYWGTLSTSALRDDLDCLQYNLVKSVISLCSKYKTGQSKVEHWAEENKSYIARWKGLIEDMKTDELNFESVNIAFRSLSDLSSC